MQRMGWNTQTASIVAILAEKGTGIVSVLAKPGRSGHCAPVKWCLPFPTMPALLSAEELDKQLAALPGWNVEGKEIVKTFAFPSYLAGIDFVNIVARHAEALNHHPDLIVGWRKVTVRLSTHSAGGVTELDLKLAALCQ